MIFHNAQQNMQMAIHNLFLLSKDPQKSEIFFRLLIAKIRNALREQL
jgi:hypothetical protein